MPAITVPDILVLPRVRSQTPPRPRSAPCCR